MMLFTFQDSGISKGSSKPEKTLTGKLLCLKGYLI